MQAYILLFAGVLFLLVGAYAQQRWSHFLNRSTRTAGWITDKQKTTTYNGGMAAMPASALTVRFVTPEGQEKEFQIRVNRVRNLEIGDAVNVLYDPLNPDHATIEPRRSGSQLVISACVILGACLFLFALLMLLA